MKVVIGSDHHGLVLREKIASQLNEQGHTVQDLGTCSTESVDYPDIASQVASAVGAGTADRGILICGSGIGMAIAANKVKGVRAAPCYDERTAVMSRSHNDLNVLCMSDDMVGHGRNLRIVDLWMNAEFEGGRHQRRVEKITQLEG
jgi:ribose 5-phosphate isomerase B